MLVSSDGKKGSRDPGRGVLKSFEATSSALSEDNHFSKTGELHTRPPTITVEVRKVPNSPERGTAHGSLFCERRGELVLNLEAVRSGGEWAAEEEPARCDARPKLSDEDAIFLEKPDPSFSFAHQEASNLDQDPLVSSRKQEISAGKGRSIGISKNSLSKEALSWPHAMTADSHTSGRESEELIDSTCWLKSIPSETAIEADDAHFTPLFLPSTRTIRPEYYLPLSEESPVTESSTASYVYGMDSSPMRRQRGVREVNTKVSRGVTSPQRRDSKSRQSSEETTSTGKVAKASRSRECSPVPKSRRSFESSREPLNASGKKFHSPSPQKIGVLPKPFAGAARRPLSAESRTSYSPAASARRTTSSSLQRFHETRNNVDQEDDFKKIVIPERDQVENLREKLEDEGESKWISLENVESFLGRSSPARKVHNEVESLRFRDEWPNSVPDLVYVQGSDNQRTNTSFDCFSSTTAADEELISREIPGDGSLPEQKEDPSLPGPRNNHGINAGRVDGRGINKRNGNLWINPISSAAVASESLVPTQDLTSNDECIRDNIERLVGMAEFDGKEGMDDCSSLMAEIDTVQAPCKMISGRLGSKESVGTPAEASKNDDGTHCDSRADDSLLTEGPSGTQVGGRFHKSVATFDVDSEDAVIMSSGNYLTNGATVRTEDWSVCSHESPTGKGHPHLDTEDAKQTLFEGNPAGYQAALEQFGREVEQLTESKLKEEADCSFVEPQTEPAVDNRDQTEETVSRDQIQTGLRSNICPAKTTPSPKKEDSENLLSTGAMWIDSKLRGGDTKQRKLSLSMDMSRLFQNQQDSPVPGERRGWQGEGVVLKDTFERSVSQSLDFPGELPAKQRLLSRVVRSLSFGEEEKRGLGAGFHEGSKAYLKKASHLSRSPSPTRFWTNNSSHFLGGRDVPAYESRSKAQQRDGRAKGFQRRCKDQQRCEQEHFVVADGLEDKSSSSLGKEAQKVLALGSSGIAFNFMEGNGVKGSMETSKQLDGQGPHDSVTAASTTESNGNLKIEEALEKELAVCTASEDQIVQSANTDCGILEKESIENGLASLCDSVSTNDFRDFKSADEPPRPVSEEDLNILEFQEKLLEEELDVPTLADEQLLAFDVGPTFSQSDSLPEERHAPAQLDSLPIQRHAVCTTDETRSFADLPITGFLEETEVNSGTQVEKENWLHDQVQLFGMDEDKEDGLHHSSGPDPRKHGKASGCENGWIENVSASSLSIYKNPLWSEELGLDLDKAHKSCQDKEMLDLSNVCDGLNNLSEVQNTRIGFHHSSADDVWNTFDGVEGILMQCDNSLCHNDGGVPDTSHRLIDSDTPLSRACDSGDFPSECLWNLKEHTLELGKLAGDSDENISTSSVLPVRSCSSAVNPETDIMKGSESKDDVTRIHNDRQEQPPNRIIARTLTKGRDKTADYDTTSYSCPAKLDDDARNDTDFAYCNKLTPADQRLALNPPTRIKDGTPLQPFPKKQMKRLGSLNIALTSNCLKTEFGSGRFFRKAMEELNAWTCGSAQTNFFHPNKILTDNFTSTLGHVGKQQATTELKSTTTGSSRISDAASDYTNHLGSCFWQLHPEEDNGHVEKMACKIDAAEVSSVGIVAFASLSSDFQSEHSNSSGGKAADNGIEGDTLAGKDCTEKGWYAVNDLEGHLDCVTSNSVSTSQKHFDGAAVVDQVLGSRALQSFQADHQSVCANTEGADTAQLQTPDNQDAAESWLSSESGSRENTKNQHSVICNSSLQEWLIDSERDLEHGPAKLEFGDCQCSGTRISEEVARNSCLKPSQQLVCELIPYCHAIEDGPRRVQHQYPYDDREPSGYENQQVKSCNMDERDPLRKGTLMDSTSIESLENLAAPDLAGEAGEDVKQVTYTPCDITCCDSKQAGKEKQAVADLSPEFQRDLVSTWVLSFFSHARKGRDSIRKKDQKQLPEPEEVKEDQPELGRIEKKVEALEAEIFKFKEENKKLQKLVKCLIRKMRRLQRGSQVKKQTGSSRGFMICRFSIRLRRSKSTT